MTKWHNDVSIHHLRRSILLIMNELELSQREMSLLLGISHNTLANWLGKTGEFKPNSSVVTTISLLCNRNLLSGLKLYKVDDLIRLMQQRIINFSENHVL